MSPSYDYSEFAEECLVWAKTAKSLKERAIFLQMAQTWLEAAAAQVRRDVGPVPQPRSTPCGRTEC
jgi:hypothetical protein